MILIKTEGRKGEGPEKFNSVLCVHAQEGMMARVMKTFSGYIRIRLSPNLKYSVCMSWVMAFPLKKINKIT